MLCFTYNHHKGRISEGRERSRMEETMGMTDNQYKDFVEAMKEDLEELNEYKEAGEEERYVKKYSRIMERLEKSLNR